MIGDFRVLDMIDIHTHIIPFVDDGSSSLEDSLRMLQDEVKNGVDEIICTPHFILGTYGEDQELIKKNYKVLRDLVEENHLRLQLHLGMEIAYTEQVDLIRMLQEKMLLTMGESNDVLLEFNYNVPPRKRIDEIIYNFNIHGYRVILAHVERYSWMEIKDIELAKKEGCIIQVNASALTNKDDKQTQKLIKTLFKRHLVDIIASDIHSFRKNTLAEAIQIANKYR